MTEVKVLAVGKHQVEGDRVFISATSTLIKSDRNIVVDPGYFPDEQLIIDTLAKNSLKPEDIEIVVLTHLHIDHVVNVHLFKNAKVYLKLKGGDYPGQFHVPKQGYLERLEMKDGLELAKDVEFLLTPGHVEDHISLVVNTTQGKVVIAGDAIGTQSLVDLAKEPLLFNNLEQFNDSRRKILAVADYIIPGHGDMFLVDR